MALSWPVQRYIILRWSIEHRNSFSQTWERRRTPSLRNRAEYKVALRQTEPTSWKFPRWFHLGELRFAVSGSAHRTRWVQGCSGCYSMKLQKWEQREITTNYDSYLKRKSTRESKRNSTYLFLKRSVIPILLEYKWRRLHANCIASSWYHGGRFCREKLPLPIAHPLPHPWFTSYWISGENDAFCEAKLLRKSLCSHSTSAAQGIGA